MGRLIRNGRHVKVVHRRPELLTLYLKLNMLVAHADFHTVKRC
jgi:hypothetical protein